MSDAISVEKIEALRAARMEVSKQIMELKSKMDDRANAKINVTGMLYENVVINLGNITEEIKEQRKGPMSIIENTVVGGLRYLSMTGLNVKAADIEKAFVFEQARQGSQIKQKK